MDWLESHPVTVDVTKWILVIAAVWISGAFTALRRFTQRPHVEIYGPACFCYLEDYKDPESGKDSTLAVFVLNPAIKNPSDRSFEIDKMLLSYDCQHFFRKFQQELFPVSFPARPRKAFGVGVKVLPVFFTRFGDEMDEISSVQGKIGPKSLTAAYLMFISNTWGSWRAKETKGMIEVRLRISTVGEGSLVQKVKIRVFRDKKILEDFCPTLYEHAKTNNLWNQEWK
jgi:hypothetical protein